MQTNTAERYRQILQRYTPDTENRFRKIQQRDMGRSSSEIQTNTAKKYTRYSRDIQTYWAERYRHIPQIDTDKYSREIQTNTGTAKIYIHQIHQKNTDR